MGIGIERMARVKICGHGWDKVTANELPLDYSSIKLD